MTGPARFDSSIIIHDPVAMSVLPRFFQWRPLLALLAFWPSSHYALLSLFFFAGLELAYGLRRLVLLLVSIMLTITVFGIILIRTEERGWFHPTQVILPTLAAFGITAFSLFLPTNFLLHLYFTVSAIVFFYLLKHGAKQAYPTWNWLISLVVLFVTVAAVLGWRFHLYIPIIFILPVIFLIVTLMSVQILLRYTNRSYDAWLLSLTIGFVVAEMVWVLQFLPLHFIVQTGLVTAVYYVIVQLTAASYEQPLSRQELIEHIGIGTAAALILLLTARWS